ncbi:MAG: prephenate dehydratase [Treponema sp.]|jgi:chorismate mutase/prephenate dehydratase|nr:prephenate dehydratase [Treponema sp.]
MIDIKNCRKPDLQETANIACQGVEGAYSQIAANALFKQPDIMYMRTFDGVFRAVNNGLCRYGVLPLENSNAGSVTDVYDLMKMHKFFIVRSVKVPISHMLLQKTKTSVEKIKEIYTHEQAARQCSKFLEQNNHIKINLSANTAAAAQFVAESERTDIAAIASQNCIQLYNLTASSKNIQNNNNNYTRFICISKECEIFDNADRISLMLSLENKAGALYEILKQFAERHLNLIKLESRPITDTDFEFMFYFDVQANIENEEVHNLLLQLKDCTRQLVFLGNYSEISLNN